MASHISPVADATSEIVPLFNSTNSDIQLLVRNINSSTSVIQAHPYDTLDFVLNGIGESMAYTTRNLCAVYAGRELSLEATIGELQLPRDAVIHLTSRLHSTQHPDAWNLVSKIIDIGYSAIPENSAIPIEALEELVRRFLDIAMTAEKKHSLFDSMGPKPEPDPTMEYLSIFLQSGVAKILVQLYLSTYVPNRVAAQRIIRHFVSRVSRRGVLVYTVPMIMEFCRLIRVGAGSNDTMYINLRDMLVTVLSKPGYIQQQLPDMPCDWTAEQVMLFAREAAHVAMNGAFSGTASAKALFNFGVFSRTLQFEVRVLGAKSSSACLWRVTPCSMLEILLECVDECMERFELDLLQFQRATSSREPLQPPKWYEPCLHAIWTVLTELDLWSELVVVDESLELRHKLRAMLAAHNAAVTALVVSVDRHWTVNIRWISRHRDVLAFEARRHLALTLLANIKTDIDAADVPHTVLVNRSRVLSDSIRNIVHATPQQLHAGLFVEFKDEVAIGPGVMREWFCLVCQALFNPRGSLFSACPQDRRRFFLNPSSNLDSLHMRHLFFSGRIIALALMHKIHVGVFLDRTLFLQLAGRDIILDDIIDADPLLHASCKKILEMDVDLVNSDALGLTFSREVGVSMSRKSIELVPGGRDIVVTSMNRSNYIHLLIQDKFVKHTINQLYYLSNGLKSMLIGHASPNMFFESLDIKDFDQMIGGNCGAIDIRDWISHTKYNGYSAKDCHIRWFWKAVGMMTVQQQRSLLFFWAAVKYLPFDGFSGMESKLFILKPSVSPDHLPTSSTCFYQLRLPAYTTFDMMQSRLQMIVQDHVSGGFGEL